MGAETSKENSTRQNQASQRRQTARNLPSTHLIYPELPASELQAASREIERNRAALQARQTLYSAPSHHGATTNSSIVHRQESPRPSAPPLEAFATRPATPVAHTSGSRIAVQVATTSAQLNIPSHQVSTPTQPFVVRSVKTAPAAAEAPTTSAQLNTPSHQAPAPAPTKPLVGPSTKTVPPASRRGAAEAGAGAGAGAEAGAHACSACAGDLRLSARVYMCARGHSMCASCSGARLCRRDHCQRPATDMRNFALESFLANTQVACPHSGCGAALKRDAYEAHVARCPHGDIFCPSGAVYGICCWTGDSTQLKAHYESAHRDQLSAANSERALLGEQLQRDRRDLLLVQLGAYLFLVHLSVETAAPASAAPAGLLRLAVQMIGGEECAAQWSYELHVYNKRAEESRRKYVYRDACLPYSASVHGMFVRGECAALPLCYAETFVNGSQGLSYKVFIRKDGTGTAAGTVAGSGPTAAPMPMPGPLLAPTQQAGPRQHPRRPARPARFAVSRPTDEVVSGPADQTESEARDGGQAGGGQRGRRERYFRRGGRGGRGRGRGREQPALL